MKQKLRSYLEDYENDFRAKKVWTDLEKKQNYYYKSPIKYINNSVKIYAYNNNINYNRITGSWRNEVKNNSRNSSGYNPQVLIKITGNDKSIQHLKAHIRYISRNGKLDVYVNNGFASNDLGNNFSSEYIVSGKSEINNISNTFQNGLNVLPNEKDLKPNSKNETMHMVFSMKGETKIPAEVIRQSALKVIRKKFSYNHFVLAVHKDTANPHCHIVLKCVDEFGKRVRLSPKDLNAMRDDFAKNLNELGYYATNKKREYKYKKERDFSDTWNGHKPHHYEVVNFGTAKYNFSDDKNATDSFFVQFKKPNGEFSFLWGKEFENLIKENKIEKGEFVRFVITDQIVVHKKVFDKKTKRWATKDTYKNVWDCSIENRFEKELNPLSEEQKRRNKNYAKYSYEPSVVPIPKSSNLDENNVIKNSEIKIENKPNQSKSQPTNPNNIVKENEKERSNPTPNKGQDHDFGFD